MENVKLTDADLVRGGVRHRLANAEPAEAEEP